MLLHVSKYKVCLFSQNLESMHGAHVHLYLYYTHPGYAGVGLVWRREISETSKKLDSRSRIVSSWHIEMTCVLTVLSNLPSERDR